MTVPNVPRELVEKILSGDCVAFIGAGLSQGAGLPNWPGLLHKMLDWAEAYDIEVSDRKEIEYLISKEDYLNVAEELFERFGKDNFRRFMDTIFREPNIKPTKAHVLLAEIPFAAYLTTNYDTLLEAAYTIVRGNSPVKFTHNNYPALSAAPRQGAFYILKVHGTIDEIETIILGRTGYREIMHSNSACRAYLQSLFSQKMVLFLGFSLSDPHLMLILEGLQAIYKGYTGNHFALMDANVVTNIQRKRFQKDYNIRILAYTPSDNNHPEVVAFLKKLAEETTAVKAPFDVTDGTSRLILLKVELIKWLQDSIEPLSRLGVPIPYSSTFQEAKAQSWWGDCKAVDINFEGVERAALLIDEYNALPRGIGSVALRQRFLDDTGILDVIRMAIKSLQQG